MSSDRQTEPAEAGLTGHKRDATAAAITDKQSNEHADTGGDNNKRARLDGDGAADSGSSASGHSARFRPTREITQPPKSPPSVNAVRPTVP